VRDSTGTAVVGAASIEGTIVAADTSNSPIRRAMITLSGGGARGGGGGRGGRVTVSDDAGAFRFTQLPAGRYTIGASKPGWVATQYGAMRPGRGTGVTINLADGQQLAAVNMKMTHGAALTGTLFGDGKFLPQNVQLRAYSVQTIDGERRLSGQTGTVTYDERGVYRIYGLPPGDYVIGATFPSMGVDLRMATEEELLWAEQLLKRPPSITPTVTTSAPTSPDDPPPPPQGSRVGYAPVYYPGTLDPSQSDTITVHAAEERKGLDFPLRLLPTARIRGTVIDPDGRLLQNAQVVLGRTSKFAGLAGADPNETEVDARNGVYTLTDVAPGDYLLLARATVRAPAGPPGLPSMSAPGSPPRPPATDAVVWASVDVHVDGHDVSDQDLHLRPAMTVSGRLAFEDAPPPTSIERASVSLNPRPVGVSTPFGPPGAGVNADGTFAVTGVTPGRYAMTASSGPGAQSWSLKSVVVGGRDVTDSSLDVAPDQSVQGVVVTLTGLSTEVAGQLLDASGKPSADEFILIFTTNKTRWSIQSRWVARGRPDTDGHWRIANLPPGDYFVCALADLDPNDLNDPAFLEQIAASSFTITLGPGEKRTMDLKVGGRLDPRR
jgi:hypothetical protein